MEIKTRFERYVAVPCLFFCARLVLWRRHPTIIGITGTVGKTTTTEMIAAVLMQPEAEAVLGRIGKSSGNLNDDVGLPLAILRYPHYPSIVTMRHFIREMCRLPVRTIRALITASYPRVLVLEYAASSNGDVSRLATLARPTVGIVTAVGPGHLERFKTMERLVANKAALVRNVPPSGLVILGADNPYSSGVEHVARAPVVKVAGRGRKLSETVARIVGRHFGIPEHVATRAIAQFDAPPGRLNHMKIGRLTVIDDSFNANPLSMQLGLDALVETADPGQRRIAILGTMAELGEDAPRYHSEIGAYGRTRANVVIGVGTLARHYQPAHWFATTEDCAEALHEFLMPGDCVLLKGSHSVGLSRLMPRLTALAAQFVDDAGVRLA